MASPNLVAHTEGDELDKISIEQFRVIGNGTLGLNRRNRCFLHYTVLMERNRSTQFMSYGMTLEAHTAVSGWKRKVPGMGTQTNEHYILTNKG